MLVYVYEVTHWNSAGVVVIHVPFTNQGLRCSGLVSSFFLFSPFHSLPATVRSVSIPETEASEVAVQLPQAVLTADEKLEVKEDPSNPGDIHLQRWRPYWHALHPGKWVMSVLEQGYRLPVPRPLSSYKERNNASAREHMPFVRQQTEQLIIRGVVCQVHKPPTCINPLTVASRVKDTGEVKLRMCLDLSRHVNVHMTPDLSLIHI